jgi:hypothetical protein
MELIERKFEINKLPQVGDKEVNGETLFVQATGVRIKRQMVTGKYFFDLDKKFFVAKDRKGNYVNGKIVGEYL